MKQGCFIGVILLIVVPKLYSQTCFDAYDLLFADEYKKLSYNEFHKLELDFLENLNGCNAIDFNVVSIAGEELMLEKIKGKVVVLNFWFTTCLPCLKEIPELNKLVKEFDPDEVVFIAFTREDKPTIEAFFKKFGPFNYKIVPQSAQIADAYKVVGWPQSMVIDKQGKVFKTWAGLTESPEILKTEIKMAINECQVR